jgi:thioredoxin-related protein
MKTHPVLWLTFLLALPLGAAEPTWLTDLAKAQAQAGKEKKMILMNFTGSDWCGWCKKLRAEVFTAAPFVEYANKHVVLVEVDFPRTKPQTPELKQANAALKRDYAAADGYPTIVVLKPAADGTWKPAWKQVGARISDDKKPANAPEDPKAWVAKLEAIRKQ